jgi:hypothetical protein
MEWIAAIALEEAVKSSLEALVEGLVKRIMLEAALATFTPARSITWVVLTSTALHISGPQFLRGKL